MMLALEASEIGMLARFSLLTITVLALMCAHIVEITVRWHWARDIEAMRGCRWRDDNGRDYIRWCFANLITAHYFAREFGGSIVMGR